MYMYAIVCVCITCTECATVCIIVTMCVYVTFEHICAPHKDSIIQALSDLDSESDVNLCSWVKVHFTQYKPGQIVIPAKTEDSPVFSLIDQIICTQSSQVYFVFKDLTPPEFCEHFHAYSVQTNLPTCPNVRVL